MRLLQKTTTEYEQEMSDELPPMPDWVRNGELYACQRSTPAKTPNDAFVEQLRTIRLARILTADEIGVRAYSTSIASIKAYPREITGAREIMMLPGCDVKIANLWIEWKNNDGVVEEARVAENDADLKVMRLFYEIWGVGEKIAREFYRDKGWRDLDDIVEYGWHELSRVQQIGVKYYDEFLEKILVPKRKL